MQSTLQDITGWQIMQPIELLPIYIPVNFIRGIKNANLSRFYNEITKQWNANNYRMRTKYKERLKIYNSTLEAKNEQIRTYNNTLNHITNYKTIDIFSGLIKTIYNLRGFSSIEHENDQIKELQHFITGLYNYKEAKRITLSNIILQFTNDNGAMFHRTIDINLFLTLEPNEFLDRFKQLMNGQALYGSESMGINNWLDLEYITTWERAFSYDIANGANKTVLNEYIYEIIPRKEKIGKNRCINEALLTLDHNTEAHLKTLSELIEHIKSNQLQISIITNHPKIMISKEKRKVKAENNFLYMISDFEIVEHKFLYSCGNDNGQFIIYDKEHVEAIKPNKKIGLVIDAKKQFLTLKNAGEGIYKITKKNFNKEKKDEHSTYKDTDAKRFIVYDYETITGKIDILKLNEIQKLAPYSLSWLDLSKKDFEGLGKMNNTQLLEFFKEYNKVYNVVGWDCGNRFCNYLLENQANTQYNFVSFNGAKFDHLLLYNDIKEFNNENLKIDMVQFDSVLRNFRINGRHILKDFYKLNPNNSLKGLCNAYKLPVELSKIDFVDFKDIQMLFEKDSGNFIKNIQDPKYNLVAYNNNDIIALAILYSKYIEEIGNIAGFEWFKYEYSEYDTIVQIIKRKAEKHIVSSFNTDSKLLRGFMGKENKLTTEQYEIIKNNKVGGRCDTFEKEKDHIKGGISSLDNNSLYPFCMGLYNVFYPMGQCINTDIYKSDKLGFYLCEFNQLKLQEMKRAPLICLKTKAGNNWTHYGEMEQWITTEEIELLEHMGVSVKIKKGMYWTDKIKSCILYEYMSDIIALKQNEDLKKKENDITYNPVKREMLKLLMNSLSGAENQSLYEDKKEIVDSKSAYLVLLRKYGEINIINNTKAEIIVQYKQPLNEIIGGQKRNACGLFIYAYSRCYMYKHTIKQLEINECLYMDTDAIKTRKIKTEFLKDYLGNQKIPVWEEVEKKMIQYKDAKMYNSAYCWCGGFKEELDDNNNFIKTAKKQWAVWNDKNDYIKYCLKGINKNSLLIDGAPVDSRIIDVFKTMLKGEIVEVMQSGITRHLRQTKKNVGLYDVEDYQKNIFTLSGYSIIKRI